MQPALDLRPAPVTPDVVRAQATFSDALRPACQVSGKQAKSICMDLDIDAAQWSRITSGTAHFPHDKLCLLMDVVKNEIVLEWLAYKRGRGLVLLETEKDRQIRELQLQLERERTERQAIQRFLKETKN